jgi:hypothetical protein
LCAAGGVIDDEISLRELLPGTAHDSDDEESFSNDDMISDESNCC